MKDEIRRLRAWVSLAKNDTPYEALTECAALASSAEQLISDIDVITRQLEETREGLSDLLKQYSLFVGPDDAIANATKDRINALLAESEQL